MLTCYGARFEMSLFLHDIFAKSLINTVCHKLTFTHTLCSYVYRYGRLYSFIVSVNYMTGHMLYLLINNPTFQKLFPLFCINAFHLNTLQLNIACIVKKFYSSKPSEAIASCTSSALHIRLL